MHPFKRICQRLRALCPPPAPLRSEGKAALGRYGEACAANRLVQNGYLILHRNARFGGHEVDIVAQKGNCLVFCEVKTRTLTEEEKRIYGRPAEAVNERQRCHLRTAAKCYLHSAPQGLAPRFDVMEVYLDPKAERAAVLKIVHLQDAFR